MNEPILAFADLIDLKAWQKIQDNFSVITGIGMRTLDNKGATVTSPSGEPRLCSRVLKYYKEKNVVCGDCLPTFLGGEAIVDKNLNYTCQAGLCNFFVPVRLRESRVLGYVILGPVVLVARKTKEEYRDIAEKLYLNLEDFWNAFLEIKTMSLHGMQSLVQLVEDLCEYAIALAYKNILQEKEAIGQYSARLNKILNVLLDVAFDLSSADIGSVMFTDASQEYLTIRASKGIPDDVAQNTKVRIGEEISGIAVKDGDTFLINDENKDPRIRRYLSRPYLGSSMVLPIKLEEKTVGVMNLGVLKGSGLKFNPDNIQTMNRLISLVTEAISPSV